jgi:tRNA dimethylallyltransferase
MVMQAQAATRRYAKRQYTWFRHQPPEAWERIDAQLNDNLIASIATKLHEMALTD